MTEVRGTVRVPGDKSISHRALMLAALGDGVSQVRGLLDSADVRSTAGVLRALGAAVPEVSGDMRVAGVGLRGLRPASGALDCGNSGTTARLMAGVVAGAGFSGEFVGDQSLSRRPMRRIAAPLELMGARVDLPAHGGLPMTVHGSRLRGIEWRSDVASAQVKSAVLLAALVAGVDARVIEPVRSRDHTERMLAARGVRLEVDGGAVLMEGTSSLAAGETDVPGDPSSAAFFAALAAMASSGELAITGVGMNPTRAGFIDVLARMGAVVEEVDAAVAGGEPTATLRVGAGRTLRAVTVGGPEVPSLIDELPLLACIAARAEGTTTITGAAELRVKESDRIAAVVAGLRAIGVEAGELPDGMRVTGSDRPLAGRVVTHGDHRLAMAFGVLGALRGNAIEIDDPDCVAVSYPRFWSDLRRVTGA